jgi:citrate lyase beta subunit
VPPRVRPRLRRGDLADVDALLGAADAAVTARRSVGVGARQPVHTVYVPADRVGPNPARAYGAQALDALFRHVAAPDGLAEVTGIGRDLVWEVFPRLLRKLRAEPVEDLRIDLEDGYGTRPDDVEDADAVSAAGRVLASRDEAPPWWGLRVKSLEPTTRRRALRTLDLVLGSVLEAGELPPGFVVTLPKVTSVEQVAAMALVCERLEAAYGLPAGRLRFEVQVETPEAVLGADGTVTMARAAAAAGGRLSGLHFGTYDYSAALGIGAAQQSLDHPVADHAKAVMQVAAAATGVHVCDGSTNVLPVGGTAAVHAAWRLHAHLVRRSLERGIPQGWDLHPAQLVTRYLATFAFYRENLETAGRRLTAYLTGTSTGVLDEPATVRALAVPLLRGLQCGAVDEDEVRRAAGVGTAALLELAGGGSASHRRRR